MTFTWNPKVISDAMRMAGKGLQAAAIYATNCTKEILSVPAPRVRLTDKQGAKYYVAGFKMNDKKRLNPILNPYLRGATIASTANSDWKKDWKDWKAVGDYGNRGNFRFPKGGIGPVYEDVMEYQTAPAIAGEPPRKLSGALRRSITYEMLDYQRMFEGVDVPTRARVGTNIKYAKALEYHPRNHEFLGRVFRERAKEIEQVLYDNAGGAAL